MSDDERPVQQHLPIEVYVVDSATHMAREYAASYDGWSDYVECLDRILPRMLETARTA